MGACGLHCLKINHISVSIGENVLLSDVSLHAHCGELTAIIGRNGAGKSTLFKAVLGELPHTGTVEFSGHDGGQPPGRLRIGYVPQTLSLDPGSPATVLDMALAFGSRYPAFLPRRKKTVEAIRTHFARFAADGLLDKAVGRLSGGELQRTLLAIATRPQPDLLVLDEPVSGVDQAGLKLFYDKIEELRATDDMVILLISHDLGYVRRHADRVLLLDREVKAAGTPEEVFSSAAFREAFPGGGLDGV